MRIAQERASLELLDVGGLQLERLHLQECNGGSWHASMQLATARHKRAQQRVGSEHASPCSGRQANGEGASCCCALADRSGSHSATCPPEQPVSIVQPVSP